MAQVRSAAAGQAAEVNRAFDGRFVRQAIDELVDVARRDLDLEASTARRPPGSPVAGMRSAIVRSAARPGAGERGALEEPAGHLFVEREPDAIRQLRVEERPRAADSCGSGRGLDAGQGVIEAELARARLRVEDPQVGAVPDRREVGHDSGDVLADHEVAVHLADLVVERREIVQLEMVLRETGQHQALEQAHQVIVAGQPAVGLQFEFQVRRRGEVVVVADDVHAPDAVERLLRRARFRRRRARRDRRRSSARSRTCGSSRR